MVVSPATCRSDLFCDLIDLLKRSPPPAGMQDCYLRHRFLRFWRDVNLDYALTDWRGHVPEDLPLVTEVRELVEEIKTNGHRNR